MSRRRIAEFEFYFISRYSYVLRLVSPCQNRTSGFPADDIKRFDY